MFISMKTLCRSPCFRALIISKQASGPSMCCSCQPVRPRALTLCRTPAFVGYMRARPAFSESSGAGSTEARVSFAFFIHSSRSWKVSTASMASSTRTSRASSILAKQGPTKTTLASGSCFLM